MFSQVDERRETVEQADGQDLESGVRNVSAMHVRPDKEEAQL